MIVIFQFAVMGVVVEKLVAQACTVEVHVDFSGLERFMSEKFLNHAQ